jgi:hypothetical protein
LSAPQQASAFNNQIPPRYVIKNITASYTVTGEDYGAILLFTGFGSVTCTLAPSLGAGFNVTIWNNKTTGLLTVSPTSGTISGLTSITIIIGSGNEFIFEGTTWYIGTLRDNSGYAYSGATGVRASVTGSGAVALGYSTSAAAGYSSAIGANSSVAGSVTATGQGAMALGGSYASGTDSFAAGIGNNTSTYGATAANSIAIGLQSRATGSNSVAIGTAYQSNGALASGIACVAIGDTVTATGTNTLAMGTMSSSSGFGKYAYASGRFAVNGDAQTGTFVLRAATTGSTVVLTTDGSTAGTANQLIAASNQVFAVTGTLIGKQSASANIAAYTITATVVNNAGTLTVPTATLTLIGTDSIGLTTSPTLTADNTNKCMAVTSGAKTATNIRWVCTLQTSEVTYA